MMASALSGRFGILAGGGAFPLAIADAIVARGGEPHIVALDGEADAAIARHPHTWVNWGQVGRILALLKREGGGRVVIAGSVRRPDLAKLRPDLGLVRNVPKLLGMLRGGDDHVLTRVVRFFESNGIEVCGVDAVAPGLLLGPGAIVDGGPELPAREIRLGLEVIAAAGDLDIGQGVVVRNGRVIAIEGAEGTDAMLARVPRSEPQAGILVKAPKPRQELRVDMPALGPRTIEAAAKAGLAGIAAPGHQTLLIDRAAAAERSRVLGCRLVGISKDALESVASTIGQQMSAAVAGRVLGRHIPSARARADVILGRLAQARLSTFGIADGVVVARQHVLALTAAETSREAVERAASLRQWGSNAGRRARGTLVVHVKDADDIDTLVASAASARLEGLALVSGGSIVNDPPDNAVAKADVHGLFLLACSEE